MRFLKTFIILLCLTSCDYFDKKKVDAKDIIDEELKTFNWGEVDDYPSFTSCDNKTSKLERETCFRTTITNHISEHLAKKIIVVTEGINDTIIIDFLINEKGSITIENIASDSLTKTQIPNIDKLLKESLNEIPKILPAIKRGQQVKTRFILPVVVNVE